MRCALGAAALLAATVNADSGCTDDGGNSYCALVDAITYQAVGGDGSYNRVTSMVTSMDGGSCGSSPYGYSGSLSPMNEEISIHLRGPLKLKTFAAYTPGSGSSKKAKRSAHAHGHAHGHMHQHLHEKRAVGDMVIATIDGVVQSWANQYHGGAAATPTAAPAAPSAYNIPDTFATPQAFGESSADSADTSSASQSEDSGSDSSDSTINPGGPNSWGRHAFYDGETSEGLTFLNHEGGTAGSGTWDMSFGNSLSYASASGCEGASKSTMLGNATLIPSDGEVIIMTDDECDGDDCGYTRPGTVAHHGFDGDDKAFFFEFQMPSDGQTSGGQYSPVNMPAIWSLNAQIPRTLQYGNEECSCWSSGCGEFDIFEVLAAGDARMKSTMHGNKAGGSSDYFYRPFDDFVKGAMIMTNNEIHVKMLPQDTDFDFPASMSKRDLQAIIGGEKNSGLGAALFSLAQAASG